MTFRNVDLLESHYESLSEEVNSTSIWYTEEITLKYVLKSIKMQKFSLLERFVSVFAVKKRYESTNYSKNNSSDNWEIPL